MMKEGEFEYDPSKSASNNEKHGINFVEAQGLWKDDKAIETEARSDLEPRFHRIAKLGEAIWSAYYTMRDGRVRLISVRHARSEEKKRYETRNQD
jgi:uncharacterized protein